MNQYKLSPSFRLSGTTYDLSRDVNMISTMAPLVEQELLTLPAIWLHPRILVGIRVGQCLIFCVVLVNRCFFLGNYIVSCSASDLCCLITTFYLQSL